VRLLAGTSGYEFKEWKGVFYPDDLADNAWLGYYAGKFPTVEINNTFYRLPNSRFSSSGGRCRSRSPSRSRRACASRTMRGSSPVRAGAGLLLQNTAVLGDRPGPILFQLPPTWTDNQQLRGFLGLLPPKRRFAIEFRHASWFDDDVFRIARARRRDASPTRGFCLSGAADGVVGLSSSAASSRL
jgi:uncharacterized protein YecE (DUF72 family)